MKDLSKYYAVRERLMTGDLVQFNSSSLLGSSIRMMTRGSRRQYEKDAGIDVNHTAGIIRVPMYEGMEERRFLPESLEKGPALHLLSRRLEDFDGEAWWYPLADNVSDESRIQWGMNALDCISCGINYGFGDIVKFVGSRPDIDISNGLICSEMWMYCWGYKGKSLSPNELPTLSICDGIEPVRIL